MRRLVWLSIVFAVLWTGWWFFAAQALQGGIVQWFEDRRAESWQAEATSIEVSGFPLNLNATMDAPSLADPETGLAFSTTRLDLQAPAWRPGYVTLAFPQDPIVFASPLGKRNILATNAQADLKLHNGAALEVREMALTSDAWKVSAPEGSILEAQGLVLSMRQDSDTPTRYAFDLQAPAFRLGDLPRAAFRVPADWPLTFDRLVVDMTADFDRPFDLTAVEVARPQPRRIDLAVADAVWGALSVRASAALEVSAAGLLTGELALQARNWREILILAETAGIVPPGVRPQAESILGALANGSGNPDTIDLKLTFRDGVVYLGFIPLGRAPVLILR
ncbi:MAG: DUF2125 domain-containing protein [Roseobacter sp.]